MQFLFELLLVLIIGYTTFVFIFVISFRFFGIPKEMMVDMFTYEERVTKNYINSIFKVFSVYNVFFGKIIYLITSFKINRKKQTSSNLFL